MRGSAHHIRYRARPWSQRALRADQGHVRFVDDAVARERERLHHEIDRLGWQRTDSRADFIFLRPKSAPDLRQAFERAHIAIAHPFPPLGD